MSAAKSTSSAGRFAKTATSRRTTQAAGAGEAPVKSPPKIGRTAERTEKLRTTVDLSPADHRRLRQIADRLAEDLGEIEVPRRTVWLALLGEVAEDDALYERVLARIRADRAEDAT